MNTSTPLMPLSDYVLVTGGAGFIGTNLIDRLANDGNRVVVYDNLSRAGVDGNQRWLMERHRARVHAIYGDVRDQDLMELAVRGAKAVFHLAGQVAVTTSLIDPIADFEVNARGTLNVLEALRKRAEDREYIPIVYTSTNKVLGGLDDVQLKETENRYEPVDSGIAGHGIGEDRGISFCSPYGCSKGAADQYVLDYARNFGIPAVVFRMSCIYGPHQFGTEDQGWVAHFIKQALSGREIVIFGDGKQVRDALFAEDLVEAFLHAWRYMDRVKGEAFNIGGGPGSTLSLLELLDRIAEMQGSRPRYRLESWRPSDQRYFVSDTRKFRASTGWAPRVPLKTGLQALYEWLGRPGEPARPQPQEPRIAGGAAS